MATQKNRILTFLMKWIPSGTLLPYGIVFSFQCLTYFVTQLFAKNLTLHDLSLPIDDKVPVVYPFIFIYFGCYLFWIVNILVAGNVSKKHFYKLVTTSIICVMIGAIIFIVYPATITRPDVKVTGVSSFLVWVLYHIDSPVNLFPSMHCLSSWLCYIAVRGHKEIPFGFRIFTLVYAILICISTQVLKQHYIVDLIAGIVIVEVVWFIVSRTKFYIYIQIFFEKQNKRFGIPWKM